MIVELFTLKGREHHWVRMGSSNQVKKKRNIRWWGRSERDWQCLNLKMEQKIGLKMNFKGWLCEVECLF